MDPRIWTHGIVENQQGWMKFYGSTSRSSLPARLAIVYANFRMTCRFVRALGLVTLPNIASPQRFLSKPSSPSDGIATPPPNA
ncbi:MAG: hypothetical protein HOA53_12120 [Anaerolineae bacterium]|nr:hypothetical protein [Anaerolineae bacterium]